MGEPVPNYHDDHTDHDDEPEPKRRKKNLYASWKSDGDEGEDQSSLKSTENKRAKERERRRHISTSIEDLRRVIPLRFQKEKLNQVATMAMAVDYIRYLQQHIVDLEAALAQRRGFEAGAFSAHGGPTETSPPKIAAPSDIKHQQYQRQMMGGPVYPPHMLYPSQHPIPMIQRDFPSNNFQLPPNYPQMVQNRTPGQTPGQTFPEEPLLDFDRNRQNQRPERPPGFEIKQETNAEFRPEDQPISTQTQTHTGPTSPTPSPFSHIG